MPEQTAAFTPIPLDLTGLRAGQVVKHGGVLYEVERLEVRETLGGRNHDTGAPVMNETKVELRLLRARWTDKPWIDPPADVLELPDLTNPRHMAVINGQGYYLHSLDMHAVYVTGARGGFTGVAAEPEQIDVELVRNPLADPESDRG